MSKVAETISSAATVAKTSKPFFNKKGEGMFLPGSERFFNGKPVQAKLNIGQPNDKYEKEADAVADNVVQSFSEPGTVQAKPITPVLPMLQAKCDECEKEEEWQQEEGAATGPIVQKKPIFESEAEDQVQRKCAACEEEDKLQKKEDPGSMQTAPAAMESKLAAAGGHGDALPQQLRTGMESAMGVDFSDVKIHTDNTAVQLSKDLHAQAFTHGSDIYFNSGKYNPTSKDGQHLLAHELTHTVQQGRSIKRSAVTSTPAIQKMGDVTQVPPGMSCAIAVDSPGGVTDIAFGTSSDTISPVQRNMLNGFVRGWHAGGGNMNIRLDGYASTDGTDALNWQLSCARANAVKSALESPSDGSPGIAAGFITVFAQGETAEFGISLAANRKVVISSVARPVPVPVFRTETTDFGTYEVYPDAFIGPMLPNQLRETDFQRLQRNWNSMVANTGGMITNGTDFDRQALRTIMGREISRSITFRNLFVEIVEDALRPVIINVGRNNASWVDSFGTNNLDLNDISLFEASPRPGYEWVQTQGEILIHVLSERRFAAINGRGDFRPAHQHALGPGGDQERFRRDIGQTGRVISQTRRDIGGGLHEGVYTDDSGNVMRIRRDDSSGGDPVAYEIEYQPAAGAAVVAVHTRTNAMQVQVNSSAAAAENLFIQFNAGGRIVNTAALPAGAGASQQFNAALGTLVPAGATITVRLFRNNAAGPATQIATLNWDHPFDNANLQANAGGTIYNLNVSLQMSN